MQRPIRHTNWRLNAGTVLALLLAAFPADAYDWLQFNGDSAHSGNNTFERIISPGNVSTLGMVYQITLPAVADGAPVLLQSVTTSSGVRNLLFITTKAGHILAIDANNGTTIWSHQYAAGSCKINNGSITCYTTSSPAIDPNRAYVYSYGLDGKVHKYQVGDGAEIATGGWPEITTLKNFDEKESPALATAVWNGNTYLYVANGGYPGDNGDYQGHITAINLATGAQKIFNTLCSDQAVHFVVQPGNPDCSAVQSAVWARPGVVFDAGTQRLFMSTGNGNYNGNTGGTNWGDSILAINPDGTGASGKPLDTYTPANFSTLDSTDADLGSTTVALLPPVPGQSVPHLAVQGGKDQKLRLVNLSNLSGQRGPGHVGGEIGAIVDVPQGGEVLTQPAAWSNPADGSTWFFVANDSGTAGLKIVLDTQGNPSISAQWHDGLSGSSPIVANGVLFVADNNAIRARDPVTGSVLWTGSQIGGIHWESPLIANGGVYISDESSHFTAYGVPLSAATASVIEFYNAALDHYFMSASQIEINKLDSGALVGWKRTGYSFNAYEQPVPGTSPVCRYYIPPAYGDSHFYSASIDECFAVASKFPFMVEESPDVFDVALPDFGSGACPMGTLPVYRVWNQRKDSNHRYTTVQSIRDQMVMAGWLAEGYGPDAVIMCAAN